MHITIVGGGNIGTQFAVHCAEKGHRVIIYTSKPDKFSSILKIVNSDGNIIHEGVIDAATNIEEEAFGDTDLIFITVPAYCMEDISKKILPYVKDGMKIGLVPGTGGGECAFRECIEKGAVLFGIQRVPSVARLVEYGKVVCATGYREELHVGSIPYAFTKECALLISQIFDMPCIELPNYLNLTLTPSNPILHTTRLKILFKEYEAGKIYDSIPLFYEDWDNETSKLLLKCDEEVQQICCKLNMFPLSYVKSLKIHYESDTAEAMTKKISSIQGFKGLTTPSIKVEGGYVPDLNSRYFTADFSYGLSILVQIAHLIGIKAINLEETMEWYYSIALDIKEFQFTKYGISNFEEFIEFYKR